MAGLVDFRNEDEVKEYLKNTEVEFMFGCHKEKQEDSCYRLGEFLDTIRKDFPQAATVFKDCCDTFQNASCCFKAGQYHSLGKGKLVKSQLEAFKCFYTGCQQKNYTDQGKNDRIAASCTSVGLMLSQAEEKRQPLLNYLEINKAHSLNNPASTHVIKVFERACGLNDKFGCYLLSQIYMEESALDSIKHDYKLAAHYAEKACDLGEAKACHNLSIMHKRGDGVDKSSEKAKEFAEKRDRLTSGALSIRFGDE
ncbi:cytochrome c oxidase assembly factor 7B-like [Clavelina lepadiformis]|uniref:cytochrome c oxidase assembly factor 7B-like n=1 Tax=Clavelina lepadiformis TaxID=159417 RepID=UPI0040419DBD